MKLYKNEDTTTLKYDNIVFISAPYLLTVTDELEIDNKSKKYISNFLTSWVDFFEDELNVNERMSL